MSVTKILYLDKMDHSQVKPLIETSELAQILSDPKLTVINANFIFDYKAFVAKPADTWDQTFKNERIPTARFINLGKDGD
jgi:3-mercaptopyruvate sulfurtransferase SseA